MRQPTRARCCTAAALAVLLGMVTTGAYAISGSIVIVSVSNDGVQGDGDSRNPFLSDTGRLVAYDSGSALVPADTYAGQDVYVRDLDLGLDGDFYGSDVETILVSTSATGAAANGDSYDAEVSELDLDLEGHKRHVYVAFTSEASNLVPGDTNNQPDVFLKDIVTGDIRRVSVRTDGGQATGGASSQPSISANGELIAFQSDATNLVAAPFSDTNGTTDVFVHDRDTDFDDILDEPEFVQTRRVSVNALGQQVAGTSTAPSFARQSDTVAFVSSSAGLVGDDTNLRDDIFRSNAASAAGILRVSLDANNSQIDGASSNPSISHDGTRVAFDTAANLQASLDARSPASTVPDSDGRADVFVRDLVALATYLISAPAEGQTESDGVSDDAAISGDGRTIAFHSTATNLMLEALHRDEDTGLAEDVYVRQLEVGYTERVSIGQDGAEGDQGSFRPAISQFGNWVAFDSQAENLVAGDAGNAPQSDVFTHQRNVCLTGTPEDGPVSGLVDLPLPVPGEVRDAIPAGAGYLIPWSVEHAAGPAGPLVHDVNCNAVVPAENGQVPNVNKLLNPRP